MEALLKVSTPMKYQKGARVCSFEDDMSLMYILVNGQVAIKVEEPGTNNVYETIVITKGQYFGGLGLNRGKSQVMEAVALEDSIVLVTSLDRLEVYKKDNQDGTKLHIDLMKRSHAFNRRLADVMSIQLDPMTLEGMGEAYKHLIIKDEQMPLLLMKEYTCPICGTASKTHAVRGSKLKFIKEGDFFMSEYQDIDPLWFEVILCPGCGYAEKASEFEKEVKYNVDMIKTYMMSLQTEHPIGYSEYRTANQVYEAFMRYEHCLDIKKVENRDKAKAALMIYEFLRRVDNKKLAEDFRDRAFELYKSMFASGILDVDDLQLQQLYIILGKLHEHRGEFKEAKLQFRNAKMIREGDEHMKDLADTYLYDLGEMET